LNGEKLRFSQGRSVRFGENPFFPLKGLGGEGDFFKNPPREACRSRSKSAAEPHTTHFYHTRGAAPHPAKKLFEKSFLDFQKL
jgi:hypothetical protein